MGNTQNQINRNTFSQNPNVSDKHIQFMKKDYVMKKDYGMEVNQSQEQYLNPNNFQNIPNQNPTPEQQLTPDQVKRQVPQMPVEKEYKEALSKPAEVSALKQNKHEVIKLVVYVVPIIAIFVLMLRSIDDEDLMWHVRQSLAMQGIWFSVLIILNLIQAPILSTYGPRLVDIGAYILLLIGGINAYNGEKYRLPVIYEIAKSFIEGEK